MAQRYLLSNGIRLLLEPMPQLRSVSTGIWAGAGSALEDKKIWGASHLLEHMLFKGTPSRDASEISAVMDNVGGVLNAFTAKEQTCYYTRCLDEHFDLSLSLLADMYQNSLLDPKELEREKGVVIEEINMYEDSPEEVAADLFARTLWPDHSYGRNISGTIQSVEAIDREQLAGHMLACYDPSSTVIAIAGNISLEQAVESAEHYFKGGAPQQKGKLPSPKTQAGQAYIKKDIEQNHICMGFPVFSVNDDDYYAAAIVNSAFGGSASARLFQEIREKRGLSYGAYSYLDAFTLDGLFLAYASTQPDKTEELTKVMAGEFARLAEKGLSTDEIQRSKEQMKGTLLLQMESTSSVMTKLGRQELIRGRIYSPEETVAELMAVSEEDIRRVLTRILIPEKLVVSQVGPNECSLNARRLFA